MGFAEIKALLSMFQALKREAERIRGIYERKSEKEGIVAKYLFVSRIFNLCMKYNNAVREFRRIILKRNISIVLESIDTRHCFPPEALDTIIISSDTAIGCLSGLISSHLSDEERDKLSKLRSELEEMADFNVNLYKHFMEAINAYEHEMFLAAALVAGKIICYVCDKLPGRNDEDKVSNLVRLGLISSKLKTVFIKAAKKARNYFTHGINAIADRSDALSLIAEACTFAKILKEIEMLEKSQRSR